MASVGFLHPPIQPNFVLLMHVSLSLLGVPRIIENSLPEYLSTRVKDEDWELYGSYMSTSRINLNIRQVE